MSVCNCLQGTTNVHSKNWAGRQCAAAPAVATCGYGSDCPAPLAGCSSQFLHHSELGAAAASVCRLLLVARQDGLAGQDLHSRLLLQNVRVSGMFRLG